VLASFFMLAAGLNQQQATDLAGSVVSWRGGVPGCPDNGYYQSLNPPYTCKGKNFEILDELLLVKVMTRAIFEAVKSDLTVFGSGAVNINTADSTVLQSLGLSSVLAGKIVGFRAGKDGVEGTGDDNVLTTVNNMVNVIGATVSLTQQETAQLTNMVVAGVFCVRSGRFMGIAQGQSPGSGMTTQITFVFNRHKEILFWKEQ